jgi:hypothetical protein
MASGGYRQPSNPAPVSGPGALSRRTDGGPGNAKQPIRVPTGGSYGDATQMMKLQQAAPLAASPGGDVAPPAGLDLGAAMTPFGAPTEQPDTPVTDGAALGAGAGPEALGLTPQSDDDMKRLIQYLPVFEHMANQPGSSKAARNFVRSLKGML